MGTSASIGTSSRRPRRGRGRDRAPRKLYSRTGSLCFVVIAEEHPKSLSEHSAVVHSKDLFTHRVVQCVTCPLLIPCARTNRQPAPLGAVIVQLCARFFTIPFFGPDCSYSGHLPE